MDRLITAYKQTDATWDGQCWHRSFTKIYQPWRAVGTPLCRQRRDGYGFFGSGPEPHLPLVFGNYDNAPWESAVYLDALNIPVTDAYKLHWCKAGDLVPGRGHLGTPWTIGDFPGLQEKIAEASRILRAAPLRNFELRQFAKSDWTTVFSGRIPLSWS